MHLPFFTFLFSFLVSFLFQADVPTLLNLVTRKQAALRHVWHMEMMGRRMQTSRDPDGKPVTKQIEIRDLSGLSMSPNSAAMQLFKDTIYIDQTFYPERLGKLFLINAPFIFSPIFSIIKPFVDPVTIQKFVLAHDAGTKELLKEIDESVLLIEYGGQDPFVVPHKTAYAGYPMRHVEYHPFTLRLQDAEKTQEERDAIVDVSSSTTAGDDRGCENEGTSILALPGAGASFSVAARSSATVPTHLSETGCVVKWHVSMQHHDIELAISFIPDDSKITAASDTVLEKLKTSAAEGTFVCPCPGTLVFELGNSHSMLRSKVVNIACTVKCPN
jgi:hypothetical protein